MTKTRILLTTGCAVVAALVVAVVVTSTGHGGTASASAAATSPTAIDPALISAASALTNAPDASPTMMASSHTTVTDLQATGERLEQGVPLPPDGGFDISWDAAAAQGGDNESGIQGVILYQAACQWYEYALSQAVGPGTIAVLNSIPNWPSFRGQEYAQTLTQVAQSITSGDQALARAYVAQNCVKR